MGRHAHVDGGGPTDAYLSGPAAGELGLTPELLIRSLKTNRFYLFPSTADPAMSLRGRLGTVSLAAITGLRDHVTIVAGAFPVSAPSFQGEPLEVLVSEALADRVGLNVGDIYVVFDNEGPVIQIPVRVSGIWRATDPGAPFWFTRPETWQDVLLVPDETFLGALHERIRQPISEAVWYLIVDGSGVRTSNAADVRRASAACRCRWRTCCRRPWSARRCPRCSATSGPHASS